MAGLHIVKQGESLSNIAALYKFSNWKTIYYHALNDKFRKMRPNPNVIYPGDQLVIPDREIRVEDSRPTDKRHSFQLKTAKLLLRLIVKNRAGEPLSGCAYQLEVQDKKMEGVTGGDGLIEATVPRTARQGKLTIWFGVAPEGPNAQFPLEIASLDPVQYLSGVQARLNNLGYDAGPVDGLDGPRTKSGVMAFQEDNGLAVDGIAGAKTQDKLKEVYGC